MADLKKHLTYLIEQLPNNKLLKVCEHIQPKKTGTNDYLSCEEFLDNIWNRAELRKIYEIKVGENEDERKVDSEKEDAVKIDANNEDGISDNIWNEIFKTKEIGIDCRIKKIEFEKLKYYPEKLNDYLFGTSFVDSKGNPKSALILGNNGVGKTSIFQAIEFSFRNQIGEVFLRGYGNMKDREEKSIGNLCKKYLANKDYSVNEITALIETIGPQTGINYPLSIKHKSLQKYLLNLFFISDYEIYKLGHLKFEGGEENSFRMFMGDLLDLGEFLWFNSLMGILSCYKKYPEIFDDKSEETEFINNERRNIESYKEEIIKLYDQYAERLQLIAELKKSKHNEIADFLISFISVIGELIELPLPNSKSLYELKEKIKKINLFIGSIKKENDKIKDQFLFKPLLDNNNKLYSFLDQLRKEINTTPQIDPEEFKTQCGEFLNYLQLPYNTKYITSEYKVERKNIIEAIKTRTSSNNIEELINEMIESTKRLSSNERNISVAKKNVEEIIFRNRIIEMINSDAKEIFYVINNKIAKHFKKSVQNEIADTFDKVMDNFFIKGKEELEWIYEDLKICDFEHDNLPQYFSLKRNLIENGRKSQMGVKRNFNTFRYNMFCILLVISTSFAIMKRLKINFPIVIDDVFHANDFKNRSEIYDLIDSIIVSHKKIFKDEPKDLQLIIFTHDDLIFNSIRKCILDNNNKSNNDNINFGFYRLLHFDQAEKDDVNNINNVLYEFN